VDLTAAGPAGVGEHERVTSVGLGLARVQVGSASHDQPWHVGDRHAAVSCHRDRQLSDRTRLVDDQSWGAMLAGAVKQRDQRGFIVDHRTAEQRLTIIVEDVGVVLVLADVQTDPHVDFVGCCHLRFPPTRRFREASPAWVRTPSSTLRTSDQSPVPIRGPRTRPCRRQHPPGRHPGLGAR
jgi:hypothetical protein